MLSVWAFVESCLPEDLDEDHRYDDPDIVTVDDASSDEEDDGDDERGDDSSDELDMDDVANDNGDLDEVLNLDDDEDENNSENEGKGDEEDEDEMDFSSLGNDKPPSKRSRTSRDGSSNDPKHHWTFAVLKSMRRALRDLVLLMVGTQTGNGALILAAIRALAPLFPPSHRRNYTVLSAVLLLDLLGPHADPRLRYTMQYAPGARVNPGQPVHAIDDILEI